MDFERAAIKTLFYDFPVETVMQVLEDESHKLCFLQDYFSDITRWRESAFTVSEWKMLEKVLYDSWLGNSLSGLYSQVGRMLNLLEHVGNQLLSVNSDNEPIVRFDNLFRWRDISLMVGEDALSLAFLAKHDVESDPAIPQRTMFLWGDILPHDNKQLNQRLDSGMSDVHNHFNASADIFHLNWMYLMNSADMSFTNEWLQVSQEQQYHPVTTDTIIPIQCKCFAAAYLRERLFGIFVDPNDNDTTIDDQQLHELLFNRQFLNENAETLKGLIMSRRSNAFRTIDEQYTLDYAITDNSDIRYFAKDINLIYHGERNLMYQVFSSWFKDERKAYLYAGYFYLYLLLKAQIRREFIETNRLHGFENFAITQARKTRLLPPGLRKLVHRIIIQSDLGTEHLNQYIETRIAPDKPKNLYNILSDDYNRNVLTGEVFIEDLNDVEELQNHLSFVIHFLKADDKQVGEEQVARFAEYRNNIHKSFDNIMSVVRQQNKTGQPMAKIVGIDAAGSELKCRPEVFGHIFRYAKRFNVLGRTYHVGEDFYDLADGLRAIDEAILFLELDSNSRIGHALALSVNAQEYYVRRHYKMLISKQALLDNCVWLYYQAKEYNIIVPGELELYLQNTAMRLFAEIEYEGEFDMLHYWHSMLLRGNEEDDESVDMLWNKSSVVEHESVVSAGKDKVAGELYQEYLYSKNVKMNGSQACDAEYPKQIVPLITDIQKSMIREIAEKGIAIECCPSSNVMIGGFERYDKHPIFTFKPIEAKPTDPVINVSINTDDRGIFATNIRNEYSLITLAMMKMKDENGHRKYNDETIYNYIERVRANGMIQRFKVD